MGISSLWTGIPTLYKGDPYPLRRVFKPFEKRIPTICKWNSNSLWMGIPYFCKIRSSNFAMGIPRPIRKGSNPLSKEIPSLCNWYPFPWQRRSALFIKGILARDKGDPHALRKWSSPFAKDFLILHKGNPHPLNCEALLFAKGISTFWKWDSRPWRRGSPFFAKGIPIFWENDSFFAKGIPNHCEGDPRSLWLGSLTFWEENLQLYSSFVKETLKSLRSFAMGPNLLGSFNNYVTLNLLLLWYLPSICNALSQI